MKMKNDNKIDEAILRMASSYDVEQTTQSLLEDGMTNEEVYLSAIAGKLLQKYVNEEDNI